MRASGRFSPIREAGKVASSATSRMSSSWRDAEGRNGREAQARVSAHSTRLGPRQADARIGRTGWIAAIVRYVLLGPSCLLCLRQGYRTGICPGK